MSEDYGARGQGTDHRAGKAPMASPTDEAASLRLEIDRLHRELAAAKSMGEWQAERRAVSAVGSKDGSDTIARLALLEAMLETVPVGVVLADAQGRIVHGNAWVERMLKHPVLHSADTGSYGEWVAFHADGRRVESDEYPLSRVIRDGVDHAQIDVHYRRGDGTMFWMRVIGEPVRNAEGERVGATVALVDIDDEVRLLAEKEVLLGEVNHRVKNSLQLVGSILSLQARGAQGEGAAVLQSASARVRAVATVHASLYHDHDVRTVEFGEHLRQFCTLLADSLGADARKIALTVEAQAVTLKAETAVPLSLIVNELVTNAFKYAFPVDADKTDQAASEGASDGTPERTVRVSLSRDTDGRVTVEVSDNGTGAGPDGDGAPSGGQSPTEDASSRSTPRTGGLGTTLVSTLARQLGATVTREHAGGWTVRIAFDA